MSSAAEFEKDPSQIEAEASRLEERSQRFGQWRVSLFLVALFGAILGAAHHIAWAQFLSLPAVALFPVLIVLHHRTDRTLRLRQDVLAVVQEERQRREGQFRFAPSPTRSPSHDRFLEFREAEFDHDPETVFPLDQGVIDDLGLAGDGRTVFGFLDQTSTIFGALELERFLTQPLMKVSSIRSRQQAVEEIANHDAGRRRLLHTLLGLRRHDFSPVPNDLDTPPRFVDRTLLNGVTRLLFVATMATLALGLFDSVWFFITFVLLTLNVSVIGMNSAQSNPARERFTRLGSLTRALLSLETELSQLHLESDEWQAVQRTLTRSHESMVELERSVSRLEWHELGLFFEIWNAFTLWELRTLPRAERLLRDHAAEIESNLVALGRTEAYLAFACPLAEQPGFTLPESIESDRPSIEAERMGHVLLSADQRVTNPVSFGPTERIVVVTGSNMSGKSTYLKATGINLVLAGAGAPVCAESFRWTPMRLYTDVNIRDSLDDGKSYFQVEVERVRDVLAATEQGPFMLGIFDELFRGTNAHERYAISAAMVDYLLDTGMLLLLATHDDRLALRVEETEAVHNIHFREEMRNERLTFTYQMQEGRAQTRNAIRVLDRLGYPASVVATAQQLASQDLDAEESDSE